MGFSLAGIKPKTRLPVVGGLLGVLYLSGLLGCEDALQRPPEVPAPKADSVWFGGCKEFQETDVGTVCMPSTSRQITLWIADRPCDAIELLEDGSSISATSTWIEGGCQLRPRERSTKQTSTYSIRERQNGKVLWGLRYDRSRPWLFALTERMWLRADSDLQGVTGTDPTAAAVDENPAVRIDRANAAAVVLIRQGKIEESLRALAEIQSLAASTGYLSISLDVAFRRMSMLRYVGLPEEASLVLPDIKPILRPGYSELQSMLAWNEGLNLRAQEHFADAEQQVHRAVLIAKRVSDVEQLQRFMPMWADLLMALGQDQAAHEVVKSVPLDDIDPRTAANLYTSLGELELQLQQMRPRVKGNAQVGEPSLATVLLLHALDAHQEAHEQTNETLLHMDLALTNFLDGHREQANSELLKVLLRSDALTNQQRMELLDLQVRIAIDDNKLEKAGQLLEQLDLLSKQYENDQRNLFSCKVAIGRTEIKVKLARSIFEASSGLKQCINSSAKLTHYDRVALVQRLRDVGIQTE